VGINFKYQDRTLVEAFDLWN